MLLTIITFLIVLSVLVFVHELGHFLAARRFGAAADEFGLGFPPRLFGFYKSTSGKWKWKWGRGEVHDAADTVYSLNAIPLGGFVKIRGENGEEKSDPQSFASKPAWQRTIMLSAGVLMNVLLAAVIFSFIFAFGAVQSIDGVDLKNAEVRDRHIMIAAVSKDSPAEQAQLQPGDTIVSINGNPVENIEWLQSFVAGKAGETLEYRIKREDTEFTKEVTPVTLKETNKGGIGIVISEMAFVRYPWYQAVVEGAKNTVFFLGAIVMGLYELLARLFSGGGVSADVAGPVGIAVLTGQVVELGFMYLLQFTALLSLNLAVINILPFPALDGGRILFLIIEKIKGRPVRQQTEALIHNLGFMLLIILVILVTFKDIKGLFN